jgi:phosphohistidine phosphatase
MSAADRTLLVFRHGEAVAAAPGVEDFQRPLTLRGRADVRRFGATLRARNPGVVWCSPARRTRETFEGLRESLRPVPLDAVFERRIYEGSLKDLLDVLGDTPDEVAIAAIVGHNPGVTTLVRTLCRPDEPGLGAIVPGTMVALRTRAAWNAVGPGCCELAAFDAP